MSQLLIVTSILTPATQAQAGMVQDFKVFKEGLTAVVQSARKGEKLGTMIKYVDRAGQVKYKMFWAKSTKEEMAQFSPDKVSEELQMVQKYLAHPTVSAEQELFNKYGKSMKQALGDSDDLADAAVDSNAVESMIQKMTQNSINQTEKLKNLKILEDYLHQKGIVITKPELPANATASQIAAFEKELKIYTKTVRNKVQHGDRFEGKKRNVFVDAFKRFPMDAASFFVALGAISTYDLIFNYNSNPIAYDQFLDGQKDPVGVFSFYSFMVANGLSTRMIEPLIADSKNKSLRHFLPYFGMTMGMVASNMTHEIANFPYLKECSQTLMGLKKDQPNPATQGQNASAYPQVCMSAYNHWVHEFSTQQTLSNWAPSLASMWISTVLSGAASMFGAGISAAVVDKVFDVKYVELSRFVKPAGFAVRLGGVTAQTALFLLFDKVWNPLVVSPWKNAMDGGYIGKLDENITDIMQNYQTNGWRELAPRDCEEFTNGTKEKECRLSLVQNLKKLQQRLSEWRSFNMTDVLTEHSNWQQMVIPASTMMYASESFYRTYLQAVKEGPQSELGEKLYKSYPLYGITADPNKVDMSQMRPLFTGHDLLIIPAQLSTVKTVAAQLESAALKNSEAYKKLNDKDRQYFDSTVSLMKQADAKKLLPLGNRLREINNLLGIQNDYLVDTASNFYKAHVDHSAELRFLLKTLRSKLGDPRPLLYQGEAFAAMYQEDAQFKGSIEALQWDWADSMFSGGPSMMLQNFKVGNFSYTKPTDIMLANMAYGTDLSKGQKIFRDMKLMREFLGGMPAVFSGPQVLKTNAVAGNIMEFIGSTGDIYTKKLTVDGKATTTWNVLRDQNNINPRILNDFDGWWDQNVKKSQYIPSWVQWEKQYSAIMPKLIKRLWRNDVQKEDLGTNLMSLIKGSQDLNIWDGFRKQNRDSFANRSPVSNGIIEQLAQERKLYLLILGEILKSAGVHAQGAEAHRIELKNPIKSNSPESLLSYVRSSPGLSMNYFNQQQVPRKEFTNYLFQDRLTYEFYGMERLLSELKVKKSQDHNFKADEYVIYSRSKNSDFSSQQDKIEGILTGVEQQLNKMQLNEIQKKTAATCLSGLRAIADQLKTYGLIINAVSYQDAEQAGDKPQKPICKAMSSSGSAVEKMIQAQLCN